jgi:DNA-binding PadR family transcriptional regulator
MLTVYISLDIYISVNQKIEALLPLKPNWLHILLALSAGDQHGYGIMQDVLDRTSGKVRLWPATLYGSLRAMMEADLIEEPSRRPSDEDDDPRRRYYRLTQFGKRVLAAEVARLEELLASVRGRRTRSSEA